MLDYELGHFAVVSDLFKEHEGRDPQEVIPSELPDPMPFASQREYVRQVLLTEVDLRANGTEIVPLTEEGESSLAYRKHMNSEGSPSEIVAQGYAWRPGTELALKVVNA
jgi:hypothetical protein